MTKYYKVHPDYWDYTQLLDEYTDDIMGSLPVDLEDMLGPDERDRLEAAWEKSNEAPYKWELIDE